MKKRMILTAMLGVALALGMVFIGCQGNSPSDPDPVDKTALQTALAAADTAKSGITASADGTDVSAGAFWVTQDQLTTFNTTIAAARAIYDKADADQAAVNSAVTTLGTATAAFTGQKHAGTNPGGTDPGGTDPGGTDPGGTDPGGTDPGGTDPGGTDPGGTDPGGTDPGGTDPGGTDPGGTDPGGTDPGGTDPGGTDPGGTNPGGTDPGGTTDTRAELTAGGAVNVAYTATTATVTFTGATGLSLAAADFTVTTGSIIGTPAVSGDTVTVPVTFAANTVTSPKTYTVGINSSSTSIKGSATVVITQAAAPGSGTAQVIYTWVNEHEIVTSDTTATLSRAANQSLTITVTGSGYSNYQWSLNGGDIAGTAGTTSYTFSSAGHGNGKYTIGLRLKSNLGSAGDAWYSTQITITVTN
ncbi:hypothetical protein AGMMS4952_07800 [Spirochaetia bacterium]|nr:hypothetical protein AGMMS4952_07800 [Spirochaetia bacterium]